MQNLRFKWMYIELKNLKEYNHINDKNYTTTNKHKHVKGTNLFI